MAACPPTGPERLRGSHREADAASRLKKQSPRQGSELWHHRDGAFRHAGGAQAVLGRDAVELLRKVAYLDLDAVAQPRVFDHLSGVRRNAPVRARWRGVAQEGRAAHLGRDGCVERIDLDRDELATGW